MLLKPLRGEWNDPHAGVETRGEESDTMKTPMFPLILTSALLLAGCVTLQPRSGVAPTGEPLSIANETRTWNETVDEKVGQTEHYDSDGNHAGTSEQYQSKTITLSSFHWRPRQGSTFISDEDVFRITGDVARANEARRHRRLGAVMTAAGGVAMAAGVAAVVVAPLLGDGLSKQQSLGLYMGGSVLTTVGAVSLAFGVKRIGVDGHPHDYDQVQRAMDDYNRTLSAQPTAQLPRPAGRGLVLNVISGRF